MGETDMKYVPDGRSMDRSLTRNWYSIFPFGLRPVGETAIGPIPLYLVCPGLPGPMPTRIDQEALVTGSRLKSKSAKLFVNSDVMCQC